MCVMGWCVGWNVIGIFFKADLKCAYKMIAKQQSVFHSLAICLERFNLKRIYSTKLTCI